VECTGEFFSERYRVIAPDIIGFGGSQPAREWTISKWVMNFLQLLDYLQIERCTLIGLSLGGYISLPFALAHPNAWSTLCSLTHAPVPISRTNGRPATP
jgi:pimeloyl-ACP methyl ester carboxylesterase